MQSLDGIVSERGEDSSMRVDSVNTSRDSAANAVSPRDISNKVVSKLVQNNHLNKYAKNSA